MNMAWAVDIPLQKILCYIRRKPLKAYCNNNVFYTKLIGKMQKGYVNKYNILKIYDVELIIRNNSIRLIRIL